MSSSLVRRALLLVLVAPVLLVRCKSTPDPASSRYLRIGLISHTVSGLSSGAARVEVLVGGVSVTSLCIRTTAADGSAGDGTETASFNLSRDETKDPTTPVTLRVTAYESIKGAENVEGGQDFACPADLPTEILGAVQEIQLAFCDGGSRQISFHLGAVCGCAAGGGGSGQAGTSGQAGSSGTAGQLAAGSGAGMPSNDAPPGMPGSGGSAGQSGGASGTAGQAGSSGTAGQAGNGGSAGQPGNGGTSGQAGSSGVAGSSGGVAGSGAQAGSSGGGQAGQGTAGQAGQGTAGQAGSSGAGVAGSSGTAGTGGPAAGCGCDEGFVCGAGVSTRGQSCGATECCNGTVKDACGLELPR